MLLGTLEELADRLRAAADALEDVEADWLRGAADLIERGGPERQAARAESMWLEELASEARARKASLLSAWVDAAEALRAAIHAHETERGPLVEALFPVWKGASLRRHVDQALAAQTELQRRLGSAYVVRRLAELATQSAIGPALEALAAAGAGWAAERERPALSGGEAEEVRTRLLAVAGNGAQLLERVRWVVRAALVHRPELLELVFPKRGRAAGPETAASESGAVGGTVPAAEPDAGSVSPDRSPGEESAPSAGPAPRPRRKRPPDEVPGAGAARTVTSRAEPPAVPETSPEHPPARAPRRRPAASSPGATPAPTGAGSASRPARRSVAEPESASAPRPSRVSTSPRAPRRGAAAADSGATPPSGRAPSPRAARRSGAGPEHTTVAVTPSPAAASRRRPAAPTPAKAPRISSSRGAPRTPRRS